MLEPCTGQRLWQAVLLQAFIDAVSPPPFRLPLPPHPTSGSRTDRPMTPEWRRMLQYERREAAAAEQDTAREQARDWLLNTGRDFSTVCMLAGFNPDSVRCCANAIAARGWKSDVTVRRVSNLGGWE